MHRPAIVIVVAAIALATIAGIALLGHRGSADASAAPATVPRAATPAAKPRPAAGHPTTDPIPILMYHVVADPPADAPFPELYLSGAGFAAQIGWLASHGYHAVTLQDAYDHWSTGLRLPARPIVISFDDGYHSQFVTAAPILRRHGWPAVLNLEVGNTEKSWGLTPRQVRLLLAAGWELDAHTLTHPDLTKVGPAQLEEEVAGSRAALRAQFHVPVNFFCYPAGRLDDTVVAAVRSAGYLGATTTGSGLATPTDLFRLDRVRINGSDGPEELAAKLRALGA